MQRENDFLYQELADMLRSQIHSSLLKPGSLLMSENEMCRKYKVSRTSVRRALDILLEEQLIVKKHGIGTIVSPTFTPSDADSNTLVILAPYPSNYAAKGLPILIRMFQERYPDTVFRVIPFPFEDGMFLTDLAQFGISPDLILIRELDFQQEPLPLFAPIDELVREQTGIPRFLLEAFMRDGRLYALPVTYSPVYLAFHKHLFAEHQAALPGCWRTWEQLIDAARTLTIGKGDNAVKETYGLAVNNQPSRWIPFLLSRRLPGAPADRPSAGPPAEAGTFDWGLLEEVLQCLQDALYKHRVSPAYAVGDALLTQELFEEGRIAMMLTTTLAFHSNPSGFGMASLPLGGSPGTAFIANAMLLTSFSKRQELAKLFLAMSLEPGVQREVFARTGFLAASTEINRENLPEHQWEALGLAEWEPDHSMFVHRLFPDRDALDTLSDEMQYFWAGLEHAHHLVERLKTMNLFRGS